MVPNTGHYAQGNKLSTKDKYIILIKNTKEIYRCMGKYVYTYFLIDEV